MNLRFWKKEDTNEKRETILKVSSGTSAIHSEFYVCAQSPEEAKQLMKELQEG